MKSLTLFNNKGGVGKTTLSFNLAHMLARLGKRVVMIDCDPQCNLSAMAMDMGGLAELWRRDDGGSGTVPDCLDLVRRGKGDVKEPSLQELADGLWLLPSRLDLSRFEQTLAEEWAKKASPDNERALDVTTSLDVLSNLAGARVEADVVLLDIGPNLGALNRAALLACDAVIVPLVPDLFSIQGLVNVGPTLREWRTEWEYVRERFFHGRPQAHLPWHDFRPIGYVVQQHLARADQPMAAYAMWAGLIPGIYHRVVLDEPDRDFDHVEVTTDAECLALIKHFASLVPAAQMARKPLFDLKKADGIGGGQLQSVALARKQFEDLAHEVLRRLDALPTQR